MFQKIEDNFGPELLEQGNAVIYYLAGKHGDRDIDLSNIDHFLLYIVDHIEQERVILQLTEEEGQYIVKSYRELIEEGKWWARVNFL